MLAGPVPRDGERALTRCGLLGEGAQPVFTAGARYLLLALPALEAAGLLDTGREVYGRLKNTGDEAHPHRNDRFKPSSHYLVGLACKALAVSSARVRPSHTRVSLDEG